MKKSQKLLPYSLLSPGILILTVLMFIPFFRNVGYSFTNYKLTTPNYKFIGFDNYIEALGSADFRETLLRTLIWVIFNILFMFIVGVTGAFVLNSSHIKGVFLLEFILLVPWVLPEAVTGYTWKLLLNYQSGIYYKLLHFLHIIPDEYDIFAHGASAMMACVIANVWRSFPLISLTTLAKLRTLSNERIEAAVLDGANRWQLFRYIELPYLKSTLISVGTLCFIWTFNAYGIISVMTNGGPAKATQVVAVLIQKAAFQYFDYGMASTYAVLILLILLAIVLVINLFANKKETEETL